MAYVSNFSHDIFISYAIVDDVKLDGVETGWVSAFVNTLESRLSAAIGRLGRLDPWWDRSELLQNQPLDKQIEEALKKTACLVVVLTPGFLESPWCPKELEAFRQFIEDQGRADSRIFVIDLGKVTEEQRREKFPNYIPFKFWRMDANRRRRILGFPAPNALKDQDFYDAVEDLSEKIKEEFDQMIKAGLVVPPEEVPFDVPAKKAADQHRLRFGEQDFVLQIGERESIDSPYPVELIHSPVGLGKNDMPLAFEAIELDLQLQNLGFAQTLAHGTDRLLFPKEVEKVQQFGATMFERLIAGDIKERYEEARGIAQRERRALPIKLCILANELASLPWEFLYDKGRSDFLTLSNLTPLVRFIETDDPPKALPVEGPLRILGMLTSPRDANLASAAISRKRERIERAVESLREYGEIDLHWLPLNTVDELQRELNDGPWHIFHFVGHGGYDECNHEGVITMENARGEPLLLSASKLCKLLYDHFSLRLVVLNACDTASGDRSNLFSSMAAELVGRGIPAVLAMQFPISDEAAALFAGHFYESLAKGRSVTQAVTEGRKAMHLDRDCSVEWGTPVLMTSSLDGLLFQMNAQSRSSPSSLPTGSLPTGSLTELPLPSRPSHPLLCLRLEGTSIWYQAPNDQELIRVGRQRRKPGETHESGNDLVIRTSDGDDRTLKISRQHFQIKACIEGFTIVDKSSSGTFLNGTKLVTGQPYPLSAGDVISVAEVIRLEVCFSSSILTGTPSQSVNCQTQNGTPMPLIMEASIGDMVTNE